MKTLTLHFERAWVNFAFALSSISYKFWIFFLAAALCCIPNLFTSFSFFERFLVYAYAKKQGITESPAEIAIVTVPDTTMLQWQGDLYGANQLHLLLASILHSPESRIGVLVDRPFNVRDDSLQNTILKSEDKEIQELIEKHASLVRFLQEPRVTLGVASSYFDLTERNSAYFERKVMSPTDSYLRSVEKTFDFCTECNEQEALVESQVGVLDNNNKNAFSYGGFWRTENDTQGFTFLWREKNHTLLPNYLALLCKAQSSIPVSTADMPMAVSIQANHTNQLNCGFSSDTVPLRPFVSAYDKLDTYSARTIVMGVEEALSLSTFPKLVLIGAQSHLAINQELANVLHGLQHQQVLVLPWWSDLLAKSVFIFVVIFCIFFLVKVKAKYLSLKVFLGLQFLLFAVAVSLSLLKGVLFPVTFLIATTIAFYMVTSLCELNRRDKTSRQYQLASAIDHSLEALEKQQAFDESVYLLEHHPDEALAATKIAEICEGLAREQQTATHAITMLESLHPKLQSNPALRARLNQLKSDLSRTRTLQTAESKKPSGQNNIPDQIGRYQIERELGRGAVGVVYLGFDPAISRKVAIKTLDTSSFEQGQIEDISQRFFREAEAAGRLSHPNIVSVYDVGEEQSLAYIAMDYVEGVPLSHHILSEHLLPVSDVYRIVCDVASALSYAHEHQIIHRDIKPGNIMFGADPYTLKVADFGIARLLDHSRTATGEILGSPLYMSPEQLQGSKVDATADIFSLGVTFYQLLSGHLPFDAPNLAGLTYEIIHTKHKNIRTLRKDLPASAARIVNQCLQKSPRDRYQTAQELVSVLRKAIKRDFPDTAKQIGIL